MTEIKKSISSMHTSQLAATTTLFETTLSEQQKETERHQTEIKVMLAQALNPLLDTHPVPSPPKITNNKDINSIAQDDAITIKPHKVGGSKRCICSSTVHSEGSDVATMSTNNEWLLDFNQLPSQNIAVSPTQVTASETPNTPEEVIEIPENSPMTPINTLIHNLPWTSGKHNSIIRNKKIVSTVSSHQSHVFKNNWPCSPLFSQPQRMAHAWSNRQDSNVILRYSS